MTRPTVTVRLDQIDSVCRLCGKVRTDVVTREWYAPEYQGGCGDSFCWASCDSMSCKPQSSRICAPCAHAHQMPKRKARP